MTKHFPGGGPQADGEDPALRHRQGPGLSGRQPRVPPAPVRGGVRGRDGGDHALLRAAGRHGARGGRLRLQPSGDHRPAARALRLRRRRLHRLGSGHRRRPRRLDLPREVLGRRGPLRRRPARQDRRRRLRPARRRERPGAARRARALRPHQRRRGSTSRCGACCASSSGSASSTTRTSTRTPPGGSPGRDDFRRAGEEAQRRSLVLLANDGVLPVRVAAAPLRRGRRPCDRRRATATSSSRRPTRTCRAPADRCAVRAAGGLPREHVPPGQPRLPAPPSATASSRSRHRCRPWSTCFLDRPAILTEIAGGAAAVVGELRRRRRRRARPRLRPRRRRAAGCRSSCRRRCRRRPAAAPGRAVRLRGAALPVRARALFLTGLTM